MDETNDQGPKDEPAAEPAPTKKGKDKNEKFIGKLVTVLKPFGGWIRDPRMGQGRIIFGKSDVLTVAIVGYETVNGIETAKLVVMGPPPGIPIMAWGVPVSHFRIMN